MWKALLRMLGFKVTEEKKITFSNPKFFDTYDDCMKYVISTGKCHIFMWDDKMGKYVAVQQDQEHP